MSMFVYKGGGRGQKWAKICLRGLWKPPKIELHLHLDGSLSSGNYFFSYWERHIFFILKCTVDGATQRLYLTT